MSRQPYAILSDLHCHAWSAFSETSAGGVNSRLSVILREMMRAAEELKKAGGFTMYLAGDLFHIRGKVAPSVLNPTIDTCKLLIEDGIQIRAIPGNHDLENKESDGIGNAIAALRGAGVEVCDQGTFFTDDHVAMIPWASDINTLMSALKRIGSKREMKDFDVIIHAPINGVIRGIPDTGLDADNLSGLGFRRVFAGHYHNHVDFGNNVYSVGATTHQTWSDVGTKAGFLIVDDDVKWMASHAPSFIDITDETDEDELPFIVDGNYCRVRVDAEGASVSSIRQSLIDMGAAGVIIQAVKKGGPSRLGSVKKTKTLIESIDVYIEARGYSEEEKKRVAKECGAILGEAEAQLD